MHGYLAYKGDGDKPVGWCNANTKESFSKSILEKKLSSLPKGN
jgi:hypothetical protein